jgi:putative FmdB family regulatory protein
MPTYDYKCNKCELVVEIVHPMSDESEYPCEKCAEPMHILIGGAGVVFKGEGWATTDKRGNGTDIYM